MNMQFDGLACFIDHAGPWEGPSLRNLFGVWTDIHWNDMTESVDGTLNIYQSEQNAPMSWFDQFVPRGQHGHPQWPVYLHPVPAN